MGMRRGVLTKVAAVVAILGVSPMVTGSSPAIVGAAGSATVDGQFAAIGPIGQFGSIDVTVVGRGGVPATGVGAVALNVTVTNPTAPSFLTVWPTGVARPTASSLNFTPGQTVPNMVIVPVGTNGQVSFYNNTGAVDVVVDVLGWFPTGSAYTGLTPARLVDTRADGGSIDGAYIHTGQVGQAAAIDVTVVGRGGVPATGVGAVALNVTVTNPTASSFLTVWPTGVGRPTASSLNFTPGQTVPNMVIVPVGTNGQVSFYNNTGGVDVVVDVLGWFPVGGAYTGLTPARLVDSRADGASIDGAYIHTGQVGQAASIDVTVVGRGGVPSTGVGAVALNVTVTNPGASSFLTVWPTGVGRPTASSLNFTPGQTVPNMVIVPVGANGRVSFYNNTGGVDVVVDVLGWFPTGGAYTGLTPARLVDTRIPDPLPPFGIGPVRSRLVVRPNLVQVAGTDRIAVWVCDIPSTTRYPLYTFYNDPASTSLVIDPGQLASWAQRTVGRYFDQISAGRYEPVFAGLGHIQLSDTDGPPECEQKAMALTPSPFTNVLVTDTFVYGGGEASPGLIPYQDQFDLDILHSPPSKTKRYAWVGGGSTVAAHPDPIIVAHEIGHTLHWPHSFFGPGNEYDNPTDVMSERPLDSHCNWNIDGVVQPCVVNNTLAFNRFAAGWMDDGQVRVHDGGSEAVTLDSAGGGGIQMVAAPDPSDSRVMLTLEARPDSGGDADFPYGGVAAFIIDQRPVECPDSPGYGACVSTWRRQAPAIGQPGSYTHVLAVGTTTVIDGVTVTISSQSGDTFTATVSGTFTAPASLPPGSTDG
jgi:hypothetical protein